MGTVDKAIPSLSTIIDQNTVQVLYNIFSASTDNGSQSLKFNLAYQIASCEIFSPNEKDYESIVKLVDSGLAKSLGISIEHNSVTNDPTDYSCQ